MISYQLLGPIEVYDDGRPIRLGGRRQRAVLAALLLEAGKAVSVRRLTEVVWTGCPPETARSQIQICVSALRRANCPIVTKDYGYVIDVEPGQVDLFVYRGRVQAARQLIAEARTDQAVRELRSALSLWRGDALGEVPGLDAEATRLEEDRLAVTREILEAELALGRHSGLIGELRSLVARHPLQERFRALLMVALARSSRKSEALQVFYEVRQLMVRQLGIEPGAELQRVFHRVLADEADGQPRHPVARQPAAGTPGGSGRPSTASFVRPFSALQPSADLGLGHRVPVL